MNRVSQDTAMETSFSSSAPKKSLAVVVPLLLGALLAPLSSPLEATPVRYKIDFTLSRGNRLPHEVVFTYDPNTKLFDGLNVMWSPVDGALIGFPFSGRCGPCTGLPPGGVNDFSPAIRQSFFFGLLAGGNWSAADTFTGIDASFSFTAPFFSESMSTITLSRIGGGHNSGVSESGAFTTTTVPEPSNAGYVAHCGTRVGDMAQNIQKAFGVRMRDAVLLKRS